MICLCLREAYEGFARFPIDLNKPARLFSYEDAVVQLVEQALEIFKLWIAVGHDCGENLGMIGVSGLLLFFGVVFFCISPGLFTLSAMHGGNRVIPQKAGGNP